jgi:hypothetical protein
MKIMIFADIKNRCDAFLRDEKKIFNFALILGITLSIISVFVTSDIYRDVARVYAYYAREIGNGDLAGGFIGRVPMLNILLAGALSFFGVDSYRACIIVSSMFYVLTLFPLRSYLVRFLPPLSAAYGCLLFVVAPKIIRFSVSGLIDSGRYFFLIGALLFLFRLIDAPTWRRAVMFGLFAAGEAVSRGEGIIISLVLLLGLPILAAVRHKMTDARSAWRHAAAVLIALLVFVAGITPFCIGNFVKFGAFVTDMRMYEQVLTVKRKLMHEPSTGIKPVSNIKKTAEKESPLIHFFYIFGQSIRGGYEVYCEFSGLGILVLLWLRRWKWEFSVLLTIYLIHQAIYFFGGSAYRYSIYLVPMLMPFTMFGLKAVWDAYCRVPFLTRWRRFIDIAIVAGGVIFLAIFVDNGMLFVFSDGGGKKRVVADFIRRWKESNIPERRLKIADDGGFPEIVYWSGAYNVCGYGTPRKWSDCLDISDMILVRERNYEEAAAKKELELIKDFPMEKTYRVYLFRPRGTAGQK